MTDVRPHRLLVFIIFSRLSLNASYGKTEININYTLANGVVTISFSSCCCRYFHKGFAWKKKTSNWEQFKKLCFGISCFDSFLFIKSILFKKNEEHANHQWNSDDFSNKHLLFLHSTEDFPQSESFYFREVKNFTFGYTLKKSWLCVI